MELEDNQRLPGSDAAEKKKVASLRALVEGQNPAAKVPPPPPPAKVPPPPADPIFLHPYLSSCFVFIFVENKDLKATLLEDIDESQLPEIYGGKLPLVPVEESTV
ncbi:hypothetical protein B296_00055399 [Ensete ventricosum]|uniref:CRAL-TRIO domain-containing protein n=1 Tax=Ensete ventricosum TaxID=4639 RepID=A0A426XHI4_ENSVE|nr:hypothetical protein B296_00055399 [Ensete ventricosum]